MKLEFKLYEIKEESRLYEKLDGINEFVIVGEEKLSDDYDCYKIQKVYENGIRVFGGMKIDEFCMLVPKQDLRIKGSSNCFITIGLDIPKKYLTMSTIENIQRLNE